MNLFDVLAFLGVLIFLVGLFYVFFMTGKRLRGVGIIVISLAALAAGASMSENKRAQDAGFADANDLRLATQAGITDPKVFADRKAQLLADEAARLAAEKADKERQKQAEAEARQKAEAEASAEAAAKAARMAAENEFFAPPAEQVAMIAAIETAKAQFQQATNDLAKGGVRRERAKAICAAQTSRKIKNWSGTVDQLTTNGDGLGVISVKLSETAAVKTWNNSLSDIGSNTLIDPDTALFQKLSNLKEGTRIRFSGEFVKPEEKTDCFWESSMTMYGAMSEPEFIFRFTDIQTMPE
ncbi:hypothetical protein [Pannonibacter sp. SL95]|uniref:hypothetical protein n=1 Tax=Pannonibacter sp. SL95 TaxID=2995153 RepID=UPI0022749716|nr:hypothetical protein [Pannonibacter sp. SL95]MCY1707329.1 hypothetical protein [Pannonibacter sp. SL95]